MAVRAVILLAVGLLPLAASAQTRICSYATAGNPTDGLFHATNGTFVASIAAGAAAGGLLVGSFVVSDAAFLPRR